MTLKTVPKAAFGSEFVQKANYDMYDRESTNEREFSELVSVCTKASRNFVFLFIFNKAA